ncbi:MAG: 4'-phosphopantetheinyl transferase superfamily protein [Candidatus Acidiferrales bacterium]
MSLPQRTWEIPPAADPQDAGLVKIWRVSLDIPDTDLARLSDILSSEERARANRFHFAEDRRRSVVTRGALRLLLSRAMGDAPERLRFQYGPRGKPEFENGVAGVTPFFNVSHSCNEALIAIAQDRCVGVDLEHIRHDIADEEISGRYFSPAESAALRALPPSERDDGFFALWTCKEAFIKAKGGGLSIPLDQFEVTIVPGEELAPVRILAPGETQETWLIRRLPSILGYASAVAAPGADLSIACWRWTLPPP